MKLLWVSGLYNYATYYNQGVRHFCKSCTMSHNQYKLFALQIMITFKSVQHYILILLYKLNEL